MGWLLGPALCVALLMLAVYGGVQAYRSATSAQLEEVHKNVKDGNDDIKSALDIVHKDLSDQMSRLIPVDNTNSKERDQSAGLGNQLPKGGQQSDAFHRTKLNLERLFPGCTFLFRKVEISWTDAATTRRESRELLLNLVVNIEQGFMHAAIYVEELDVVGTLLPHVLREHMPQMLERTVIISRPKGGAPRSNRDAQFTDTVYILYDRLNVDKVRVREALHASGLFAVFCDAEYLDRHLVSD